LEEKDQLPYRTMKFSLVKKLPGAGSGRKIVFKEEDATSVVSSEIRDEATALRNTSSTGKMKHSSRDQSKGHNTTTHSRRSISSTRSGSTWNHPTKNPAVVAGDSCSVSALSRAQSSNRSQRSHCSLPVDLDQDPDGYDSDAGVGEAASQHSRSSHQTDDDDARQQAQASSANNNSHHNKQRLSTLVVSMSEKQTDLSQQFLNMIHKLAKYVPPQDETHVQKALQYKDLAVIAAKKQTRIAQQFEALVSKLEKEAIEKERENQLLRNQVQALQYKFKQMEDGNGTSPTEAMTDYFSTPSPKQKSFSATFSESPASHHDITTTAMARCSSSAASCPQAPHKSRTNEYAQRDGRKTSFSGKKFPVDQGAGDDDLNGDRASMEIFAIKEISFATNVVDIENLEECMEDVERTSREHELAGQTFRLIV
jgi:hypothetical protein